MENGPCTLHKARTLIFTAFSLSFFQSSSMECGMATGCVKILKRAKDFDNTGEFIPVHKRGPDVDLFRG